MNQPQLWYLEPTATSDGLGEAITPRALQQLARTGLLTPLDRVSLDGRRWVPAAKVRGLAFAPDPIAPDPIADVKTVAMMNVLDTEPTAEICHQIPGYEIQSELGSGTGGVVYKAAQKSLDRIVALKVVQLSAARRETAFSRFEQEAKMLGKLHHPNIVSIYDYGLHSGCVFMAMELLEGEDLDRRIARLGRLEERTVWTIARQTASALAHAAQHGIIHRDIKPANLLLLATSDAATESGAAAIVKVLDFGLGFELRHDDSSDQRITHAGSVVGTPAYMAPEQFANAMVTLQADIYALGATVYHALTGQIPFQGPTVWDVMVQKRESAPRLPGAVHPQVARLLADMMAPQPQNRIADYVELIRRIDELPCIQQVEARQRVRSRRPTRTMQRIALGTGLVTALIVAIGMASWPQRLSYTNSPAPVWAKTGNAEFLSDRANQRTWHLEGSLVNELGQEGEPVITISGRVGWPLRPTNADRFSIGLDLHRAESADILFADGNNPTESLALRISRTEGVMLGVTNSSGRLTPIGPTLPFPNADERQDLVPYLSIELQRDRNRWDAWFENQHLGGLLVSDTTIRPELQLRTDGRAVRIERVECLRKLQ